MTCSPRHRMRRLCSMEMDRFRWRDSRAEPSAHNDVVFQQLDAHPKRGDWSDCRGHLATASADEPLKFFDFIEDAARVLPPKCRPKLSRCMTIATPDNPIFNIAKRVGGWFD